MLKRSAEAMQRAYTFLDIKSVSEDEWVIEGVATTPTPDRVGDIVEPMGAKFSLPMPLLWQHWHDSPVGWVEFAKPTKTGIPFRARIAKPEDDDPQALKERLLEAWKSVKRGLVRAVSIGFRCLEYSVMDNGGWRFVEWEWLELSLVTIPANAECTINTVKSADRMARGASARVVKLSTSPARVRATPETVRLKGNPDMKTLSEQISALEATRTTKADAMQAIHAKASKEGRATTADENDAFDELDQEITDIDENLKRLKRLEAINVEKSAKPVAGGNSADGGQARDSTVPARSAVRTSPVELPKGLNFARAVVCLAHAQGNAFLAAQMAERHYADDPRIANYLNAKAAVPAANTGGSGWADAIAAANVGAEFVEFLRSMTIIDRLQGFRRVPFNVKVSRMTTGQTGYWVGEALPAPLTKGVFDTVTMGKTKVAAIAALSKEQMLFSNINAELAIRDDLAKAVVATMDSTFIGTAAAVSGVSPAGLLNGLSGISATGTGDADDARTDLVNLYEPFSAAKISEDSISYVTTENLRKGLRTMRSSLGIAEFPGTSESPPTLDTRPLLASNHVGGGRLIAISTPDILLADDGEVSVEMSDQASLEMLDGSLVQTGVAGTGASLVSLWQAGLVGIKVERFINWQKARAAAVAYVSGAVYQGAASA